MEVITMVETKGMKKIECPAPCSFTVKSHDEKEIIELAMQHAQNKHNMKISEKELKGMIQPA
jgi:predicted small metal-binding protein